ncbi:MAG: hypothetical protein HOP30_14375 [Cyclobacteriaceae bacterium]|nr:hypothetical protein [Cyclobacteriaceae bacterium]
MMRIAVVTYFYPKAIPFVKQLIEALQHQSFQDFEVIVFNDGVEDVSQYFKLGSIPISFHDMSGSIGTIRIQSMQVLAKLDFEGYVFMDADDSMSANRVAVARELLTKYDVVVNDLTLTDATGNIEVPLIWSSRIADGFEFDSFFIHDKNIVGLGNTAIKRSVAATFLTDRPVMAPDWYIFYQLLEKRNLIAIFTTRCETWYRQHDGNIAGIRSLTKERLEQVIKVKQMHYTALEGEGYQVDDELRKVESFSQRLDKWKEMKVKIDLNPFWWEETNFIYE